MKRVSVAGMGIESTTGAPVVLLREDDEPHRLLTIFVGGLEAAAIALSVSGQHAPRPLTHDLMAALVRSLNGELEAVEVTDLSEGTFLARLLLSSPTGERQVDTRPSDAIALALRLDAPLFVSETVLDEAGTIASEADDESETEAVTPEAIDAAVDEFRSFLDDLDPSDFTDPT